MAGLTDGEKKFEDMFIRFDRMYERDRRTHAQRHRMTTYRPRLHSIVRQKHLEIQTAYGRNTGDRPRADVIHI